MSQLQRELLSIYSYWSVQYCKCHNLVKRWKRLRLSKDVLQRLHREDSCGAQPCRFCWQSQLPCREMVVIKLLVRAICKKGKASSLLQQRREPGDRDRNIGPFEPSSHTTSPSYLYAVLDAIALPRGSRGRWTSLLIKTTLHWDKLFWKWHKFFFAYEHNALTRWASKARLWQRPESAAELRLVTEDPPEAFSESVSNDQRNFCKDESS